MKTDVELLNSFKIEKQGENLIFIQVLQSQPDEAANGRQADLMAAAIGDIVSKEEEKSFNYLIDLTLAGTVNYISPHAKEVYSNLPKISKFNKAAIIGSSLMLEVAVNLLMAATGRSNSFKWFDDKEKAMNWLEKQ